MGVLWRYLLTMKRIKQASSRVSGEVRDWGALALAGLAVPIAGIALFLFGTKARERRLATRVVHEHD